MANIPANEVQQLVQRAQAGEVQAYEQLVQRYQDKLYALSFHLTGNQADAQDLAQETFVKAYYALKGFRQEADFGTWLHRIAVNLWINMRRRQRPSVSLDEPMQTGEGEVQRELTATGERPEEALERVEMQRFVSQALGELSVEHRVVLVLREMQGFTYEEIAVVTDCSLGTVKSRINRARAALKSIILERAEDAGLAFPLSQKRRDGE